MPDTSVKILGVQNVEKSFGSKFVSVLLTSFDAVCVHFAPDEESCDLQQPLLLLKTDVLSLCGCGERLRQKPALQICCHKQGR